MPALTRYEDIAPSQLSGTHAHAVTLSAKDVSGLIQGGGLNGTRLTMRALQRIAKQPGNSLQLYPRGSRIPRHRPLHEYSHAIRLYRTGGTTGVPVIPQNQIARIKTLGTGAGLSYAKYGGDVAHQALDLISKLRAR